MSNGSRINTRTFLYVSIDENDAYAIGLTMHHFL